MSINYLRLANKILPGNRIGDITPPAPTEEEMRLQQQSIVEAEQKLNTFRSKDAAMEELEKKIQDKKDAQIKAASLGPALGRNYGKAYQSAYEGSKISDEITGDTKQFKIDIPIYVDNETATATLGDAITKVVYDKDEIKGTPININTSPEKIAEAIQTGPISEEAKTSFNTAYGNITNVKREQSAFGKATGLSWLGEKTGLTSAVGVVSDYDRRRRGVETARDVRLFLDKIRPSDGAFKNTDYQELYDVANPGKYPTGQEWKTVALPSGRIANDVWIDVRANETATAKANVTAIGDFTGSALTVKAVAKLDAVIAENKNLRDDLLKVLIDIKAAIENRKDWSYNNEPKPSGFFGALTGASWPGFVYNEEITKGVTSKFNRLVNNLNALDFNRKTVADDEGKAKNLPGFKLTDIRQYIDNPRTFVDKILNAARTVGGKRTRKNKKSKTQKRGRKNKNTKKH